MKFITCCFILILLLTGCDKRAAQDQIGMKSDPHSFSKPNEALVTHLKWRAEVKFETKTIHAAATWTIRQQEGASQIVFDTKDLSIEKVTLDNDNNPQFELANTDPIMGQALLVDLKTDTKEVSISYKTSPDSEAVQWLTPQQAGSDKPFLFTQSEAILARSWIPCQDSPSIRFTYDAEVVVPKDLLALMSATNPTEKK